MVGGANRAGVAIRPEVGVSPLSPAPPLPAALPLPLLRPHHRHGAEATPLTQRRTSATFHVEPHHCPESRTDLQVCTNARI